MILLPWGGEDYQHVNVSQYIQWECREDGSRAASGRMGA
jgi:hypothetical protein